MEGSGKNEIVDDVKKALEQIGLEDTSIEVVKRPLSEYDSRDRRDTGH